MIEKLKIEGLSRLWAIGMDTKRQLLGNADQESPVNAFYLGAAAFSLTLSWPNLAYTYSALFQKVFMDQEILYRILKH